MSSRRLTLSLSLTDAQPCAPQQGRPAISPEYICYSAFSIFEVPRVQFDTRLRHLLHSIGLCRHRPSNNISGALHILARIDRLSSLQTGEITKSLNLTGYMKCQRMQREQSLFFCKPLSSPTQELLQSASGWLKVSWLWKKALLTRLKPWRLRTSLRRPRMRHLRILSFCQLRFKASRHPRPTRQVTEILRSATLQR